MREDHKSEVGGSSVYIDELRDSEFERGGVKDGAGPRDLSQDPIHHSRRLPSNILGNFGTNESADKNSLLFCLPSYDCDSDQELDFPVSVAASDLDGGGNGTANIKISSKKANDEEPGTSSFAANSFIADSRDEDEKCTPQDDATDEINTNVTNSYLETSSEAYDEDADTSLLAVNASAVSGQFFPITGSTDEGDKYTPNLADSNDRDKEVDTSMERPMNSDQTTGGQSLQIFSAVNKQIGTDSRLKGCMGNFEAGQSPSTSGDLDEFEESAMSLAAFSSILQESNEMGRTRLTGNGKPFLSEDTTPLFLRSAGPVSSVSLHTPSLKRGFGYGSSLDTGEPESSTRSSSRHPYDISRRGDDAALQDFYYQDASSGHFQGLSTRHRDETSPRHGRHHRRHHRHDSYRRDSLRSSYLNGEGKSGVRNSVDSHSRTKNKTDEDSTNSRSRSVGKRCSNERRRSDGGSGNGNFNPPHREGVHKGAQGMQVTRRRDALLLLESRNTKTSDGVAPFDSPFDHSSKPIERSLSDSEVVLSPSPNSQTSVSPLSRPSVRRLESEREGKVSASRRRSSRSYRRRSKTYHKTEYSDLAAGVHQNGKPTVFSQDDESLRSRVMRLERLLSRTKVRVRSRRRSIGGDTTDDDEDMDNMDNPSVHKQWKYGPVKLLVHSLARSVSGAVSSLSHSSPFSSPVPTMATTNETIETPESKTSSSAAVAEAVIDETAKEVGAVCVDGSRPTTPIKLEPLEQAPMIVPFPLVTEAPSYESLDKIGSVAGGPTPCTLGLGLPEKTSVDPLVMALRSNTEAQVSAAAAELRAVCLDDTTPSVSVKLDATSMAPLLVPFRQSTSSLESTKSAIEVSNIQAVRFNADIFTAALTSSRDEARQKSSAESALDFDMAGVYVERLDGGDIVNQEAHRNASIAAEADSAAIIKAKKLKRTSRTDSEVAKPGKRASVLKKAMTGIFSSSSSKHDEAVSMESSNSNGCAGDCGGGRALSLAGEHVFISENPLNPLGLEKLAVAADIEPPIEKSTCLGEVFPWNDVFVGDNDDSAMMWSSRDDLNIVTNEFVVHKAVQRALACPQILPQKILTKRKSPVKRKKVLV
jgi:hypothetical protein